jgi:MTH538 TIR-like domain (DUF1863)
MSELVYKRSTIGTHFRAAAAYRAPDEWVLCEADAENFPVGACWPTDSRPVGKRYGRSGVIREGTRDSSRPRSRTCPLREAVSRDVGWAILLQGQAKQPTQGDGESHMARHVFLSFVEEDLERVRLFRGQAKNRNSALYFDDYSVHVPYRSQDADYIKTKITEKIRAASVTICLLGPKTSGSSWVTWEIEKSSDLGNKLLGVRLYADRICPVPSALTAHKARVLSWDIEAMVKEIG